jgi:hypothetical protein
VKKKHFIFIIQNNNKNKKHIKIKKLKVSKKKLKHEPSLKKPGDFTVAEGHGHPLVLKDFRSYSTAPEESLRNWIRAKSICTFLSFDTPVSLTTSSIAL